MINLFNIKKIIIGAITAGIFTLTAKKTITMPEYDYTQFYQLVVDSDLHEWIDPFTCSIELKESAMAIREKVIEQLIREGQGSRELVETFKIEIENRIGKPLNPDSDDYAVAVNKFYRPINVLDDTHYPQYKNYNGVIRYADHPFLLLITLRVGRLIYEKK